MSPKPQQQELLLPLRSLTVVGGPAVVASSFDYSGLEPAVAEHARAVARRVKEAERSVLATVMQAGRELQSVKDALGHGTFGMWLADEFGATARTAQKYMRLAAAIGGEYEFISHLPRALLDEVAAQSCPEEFRQGLLAELHAGVRRDPQAIAEELRDAKKARKLALAESKVTPEQRRRKARARAKQQREWERRRKEDDDERAMKEEARTRLSVMIVQLAGAALPDLRHLFNAAGMLYAGDIDRAVEITGRYDTTRSTV